MAKTHFEMPSTKKLHPFAAEILNRHMVRKNRRQKEAFRNELTDILQKDGWDVHTESSGLLVKSHNVIAGDIHSAKVIVTAHYDTPARLPLPNFIAPQNFIVTLLYQLLLCVVLGAGVFCLVFLSRFALSFFLPNTELPAFVSLLFFFLLMVGIFTLIMAGPANPTNINDNTSGIFTLLEISRTIPPEQRNKIALVWFDNEELGLVGAAAFRQKHGRLPDKLLLNFDCVGDGDSFLFIQPQKCRKNTALQNLFSACFSMPAGKELILKNKPFTTFPSDQAVFKQGIGIAAFRKKPGIGLYLSRLHTPKDTQLDQNNILLLQQGVTRLLPKV